MTWIEYKEGDVLMTGARRTLTPWEKMVESLVRLELNHAEEKNSPQFGSPKFPLQLTSRRQVPMKEND
jgi:hypothetical protein